MYSIFMPLESILVYKEFTKHYKRSVKASLPPFSPPSEEEGRVQLLSLPDDSSVRMKKKTNLEGRGRDTSAQSY
jgi:hypothetical protein